MSHDNPLIEAFEVYESLQEIEGGIMYAVAGEKAFEPFDEKLSRAVQNLVSSSADAVRKLSPRVRRARLNAIWNQILEKHQK